MFRRQMSTQGTSCRDTVRQIVPRIHQLDATDPCVGLTYLCGLLHVKFYGLIWISMISQLDDVFKHLPLNIKLTYLMDSFTTIFIARAEEFRRATEKVDQGELTYLLPYCWLFSPSFFPEYNLNSNQHLVVLISCILD
jgi:hypothetical protein